MAKAKQAKPKRKLGFAPFFLGAALVGVQGVPVWVLQYLGVDGPWAAFDWPYWHGHEMIFGYGFAVMGGLFSNRHVHFRGFTVFQSGQTLA